ncbi:nuclear transport factor 2 family protein [Novosphingobium pentaromativorans]|uniref:SnoaL-like domain-containing protein n=1 Tax=Novosphingobium pentaromativorans US6-1 TaxID=1088721 RepID=G6EGD5_9SPHN|nr:nuclear transport factor 2 family protein [Novosphingobium pentaromativorans]EHJ59824.1 hypothetical protein NSU_3406 [Novosphingobium pentaromativorans US6-1]
MSYVNEAEGKRSDESAIQKLANHYSHAVFLLDAKMAAAAYMTDGILSAFYGPDIVGRDAIETALATGFAKYDFIMQTSGAVVIEVQGDAAFMRSSVSEWMRRSDTSQLECCFGCYEDKLVRTGADWRFERRRFMPVHRGRFPGEARTYREPRFEIGISGFELPGLSRS